MKKGISLLKLAEETGENIYALENRLAKELEEEKKANKKKIPKKASPVVKKEPKKRRKRTIKKEESPNYLKVSKAHGGKRGAKKRNRQAISANWAIPVPSPNQTQASKFTH